MSTRSELAAQAFLRGYNCSQAVAVAFCDLMGISESQAARMASSFGGGMGRMREVCGGVSGMLLVAGMLYGYDTPGDDAAKSSTIPWCRALPGSFGSRWAASSAGRS